MSATCDTVPTGKAGEASTSTRPRLVMLAGSFPNIRCGISPHTWTVSEKLAQRGTFDVSVVTSARDEIDSGRPRSFALHPVIRRWNVIDVFSITHKVLDLAPQVICIQNPTLAHARWHRLIMCFLPGVLRSRGFQGRLVVTQHDLAIAHPLARLRHAALFWHADAITVSNDRDWQAAACLWPDLASKLYRAPIAPHVRGVRPDPEAREALRRDRLPPGKRFLICFFGFLVPGRRLDCLLRAVALLARQSMPVQLLLLGGPLGPDRSYVEWLQRLARELSVEDRVTFAGFLSDAAVWDGLCAADVFVSPIERGADLRNGTLLSAMLAGVPVLTTENARYFVDRDLRGFPGTRFFDVDSPADLAAKMSAWLKDERGRRDLAARIAGLGQSFSWDRHVDVLMDACLGQRPDASPGLLPRSVPADDIREGTAS